MLSRNQKMWNRRDFLQSKSSSGNGGNGSRSKGNRSNAAAATVVTDDETHTATTNKGRSSLLPSWAPSAHSKKKQGINNIINSNNNNYSNSNKRIFISSKTSRVMQIEIENLPLPASLATVAIALQGSPAVLDSFVDSRYSNINVNINSHNYSNDNNDDNDDESDGLAAALEGFQIAMTPLDKEKLRRKEFIDAASSLIAPGSNANRGLLTTWEEVKEKLSAVFLFAVEIIIAVDDGDDKSAHAAEGNGLVDLESTTTTKTTPPRKGQSTKSMTARTTRTSPPPSKRSAIKKSPMSKKLQFHNYKSNNINKPHLSLNEYRKSLQNRMGKDKFHQMFRHTVRILKGKPPSNLLQSAASKLDDRIALKESSRRSDLQVEQIIADKQQADKERQAKEAATKLLRPLTPDEQSIVQSAMYGIGPPSDILASQDADSVQRASMQRLQPGQWLNDEIINYFLKNCLAKRDELLCSQQPGRKRSHFFNSFFIQNLFDDQNSNYEKRGKCNYNNVKRWSKKVPGKDIFNLKYIVCPVNLDQMHWTCMVIFMEEKKIKYYDSLGGTNWTKLKGLLEYVKEEHKAKKGREMEGWEDWELVGCEEGVPQQMNGYDCGVFTCMICDFISKDCPLLFSQHHVNQCRDRIALSIMKNCAIE